MSTDQGDEITNEQGLAIYLQQSLSGLTSARLLIRTMYANGEYVPCDEIAKDLIRIEDELTAILLNEIVINED